MSAIDDFKAYSDRWGFVQNASGATSGNGLLYTAEAMLAMLSLNDGSIDEFIDQWNWVLIACVKPNCVLRTPDNKFGQQGPDDFHGVAVLATLNFDTNCRVSTLLANGVSQKVQYNPEFESPELATKSKILYWIIRILNLGKVPHVYNNVNPGYFTFKAWIGRFPVVIANLKIATNSKRSLIESLAWGLGFLGILFAKKDEHDKFILDWTRYRLGLRRSSELNLIDKIGMAIWLWKFKQIWGDVGSLLAAYFVNSRQPSAVYLQGKI